MFLICIQGNSNACNSGLQAYVKYYKFDDKLEVIGNNIKRKWPAAEYMGVIAATGIKKQYQGIVWRNIGYSGDYTNPNNVKNSIYYKYSF